MATDHLGNLLKRVLKILLMIPGLLHRLNLEKLETQLPKDSGNYLHPSLYCAI